jgi:predicted outer membrane protein
MRARLMVTIGCTAITFSFLCIGCGGDDNNGTANTTSTGGGGASGTAGSGGAGGGAGSGPLCSNMPVTPTIVPLLDEQLVLVMNDANAGEVGDGGLGMARASSDQVFAFAQRMVVDHSTALQQARAMLPPTVLAPQPSTLDQQLAEQHAQQQLELMLGPLSQFDAAFMCEEIDAHAQVIRILDAQTAVSRAQVTTLVQANRATAQAHLTQAQQIVASLAASAGQATSNGDTTAFCAQFKSNGGGAGGSGGSGGGGTGGSGGGSH